jgi:hypothetical protein
LVFSTTHAAAQAPPPPVTIRSLPWFDPNITTNPRKIIGWGNITVEAGYEIRSLSFEWGYMDIGSGAFTPQGSSLTNWFWPTLPQPNPVTFDIGTPKPSPVPNPIPYATSPNWWVPGPAPVPPAYPANCRWAIRIKLEYRPAPTYQNPSPTWTALEKVGWP